MASAIEGMSEEEARRIHDSSYPVDPFVSSLVQLGLSRAESRVYLAVLRLRKASTRSIARDCSMDVPAAYRAIDDLVGKGLLSLELGVPNVYIAIDLPHCVKQLLNQVKQDADSKTRIADDLLLEYSSSNGADAVRETSVQPEGAVAYRLFTSRKTADRDFFNRIAQARTEVLLVHPAVDNAYLANRYLDLFRDLSKKGVALRVITEVDNSSFAAAKAISRHFEVRSHRNLTMRFSVTDREKVSFGIADLVRRTEKDYEPYLVIADPSVANSMALFFDSLWRTSTKIDFGQPPGGSGVHPHGPSK